MIENFDEIMQRIAQETLPELPEDCAEALVEASFEPDEEGRMNMNINLADRTNNQYIDVTQPIAEALIDLHIGFDEADQGFERCQIALSRADDGGWSFNINFVRDDDQPDAVGAAEFEADTMSSAFRKLLNQHVISSIEKDHVLEDFRTDWNLDLTKQTLEFTDVFSCRVDLMGSVSNVTNTWLWGWANEALGAPEAAVAKSKSIQQLGEQHKIFEFTEAKLNLDRVHPDLLAFVVCGLSHADFYYWANFDNGAALLLGYADQISDNISSEVSRVATVIPKALQIAGQYFDHKQAIMHYLKQRDYRGAEENGTIKAQSPGGKRIEVGFDELGRMTSLQTVDGM